MALCKECGSEKPDEQVSLNVCDDCFNFGPPKQRKAEFSTPKLSAIPLKGRGDDIILTTSIDVPNRKTETVVTIVAAEVAIGMNIFRDIANNWRDFAGGRSATSENALGQARQECLRKLRSEAADVGAHAVIAVSLNYNELSTSGSGILFVAATGTAVKLTHQDAI